MRKTKLLEELRDEMERNVELTEKCTKLLKENIELRAELIKEKQGNIRLENGLYRVKQECLEQLINIHRAVGVIFDVLKEEKEAKEDAECKGEGIDAGAL